MHNKSERISKFTKLEGWYSNTSNFEYAMPVNSANLGNMFNVLKLKYVDPTNANYALYKCVQLSEIDDEIIYGTSFNSHSVGIQGAVASYDRKHKQIKLEFIDMDKNSIITCTGNGNKFRGTSVKSGTDCLGGYVGGSKLKKLKVAPEGFETFDFDDVYTCQYDFVYNIPPVITLLGANPLYIEWSSNPQPYSAYELGATALDHCDGDLTSNITIDSTAVLTGTLGTYSVIYNVTDSLGNAATMTRTVIVQDTTPPVINIIGDNPLSIGMFGNSDATWTTPGLYTWICPQGVTSVCAVAVGGGGGGGYQWASGGGGGGGLGWKNNIPVVPGQSYTVVVGAGGTCSANAELPESDGGTSYFNDVSIVAGYVAGYGGGNGGPNSSGSNPGLGGGFVGDGGGRGGNAADIITDQGIFWFAGAGAGGYMGNGADSNNYQPNGTAPSPGSGAGAAGGMYSSTFGTPGGGGVGLYGLGADGVARGPGFGGGGGSGGADGFDGETVGQSSGSNGTITGGAYGGGGGGSGSSSGGGNGGSGAVRIIWGSAASFPSFAQPAYFDAGASALDNYDGYIPPSNVSSTSTFIGLIPGTSFDVTYTAVDSNGNSNQAIRHVDILLF